MGDRKIYINQSSDLQRALIDAFNCYVESGIYFGPPDKEFRRILLDKNVPLNHPYEWGHALLHDDYHLGDAVMGVVRSLGEIKYRNPLKMISRARRKEDIPAPYSEFLVVWGRLSSEGEGVPVGLLLNGESGEEVKEVYYLEVLRDAFDSKIYEKLWGAYIDSWGYDHNLEGHEKYEDVLKNLPRKDREGLMKLNYEGKSFPSFPGIIKTVRLAVFPNSGRFYSVPLFGEGWNRDRSVLRVLLKHKDKPQVLEFLRHYGIEWLELNDLEGLFALKKDAFQRIRERLVEISKERKLGELKATPLYAHPVGTKKIGSIRPTKVDRVSKTTYLVSTFKWKGREAPKIRNLQELLTVMMANSYYLPKTVEVLHQEVSLPTSQRRKEIEEWTSVIKATFDSVVLYALLRDIVRVNGLDISKGHIVFLNFLNTENRNTVAHDYYYHLLDGIEGIDLIYDTEERTRVNVQNFGRDIYPYSPVQDEEAMLLHEKIPQKKRQNVVPYHLYEFEDGTGGVVYRLIPSKKKGEPSTVWYVGGSKLKANEDHLDKPWISGWLSQHREEYYASMSLRNTSTAGYLLSLEGRDVGTHSNVYSHGVFAKSVYKGEDSKYYLRLLKTSKYGQVNGKRVRLLPERVVYRRDNPRKSLDSHLRIFEDLNEAVGKGGIHLVHVQNLANSEAGNFLNELPPSVILVDWDGLILSKVEFDDSLGIKKHYRSWLAVLEFEGYNARVFVTKDPQETRESRIYRHPIMMFFSGNVLPDEEMLFVLGLADEKGGVSFAGTRRLFYAPYPDVSRKVIRPSLLLGGAVE